MAKQPSVPVHKVTVDRDVPVTMRDGTALMADVHRPSGSGEFPVLIERTPYNKAASSETKFGAGEFYASRGYACVFQDVRGRFGSAGDFYPFRDDGDGERKDGYDTVEWAAGQPWSNGKVGTIGGSYSGATQYRMLAARPPHLVAQFVRQSSSDYSNEWVYRNGALELAFNLSWAIRHTVNQGHKWAGTDDGARYDEQTRAVLANLLSAINTLPLKQQGVLLELSPWWGDWLDNPDSGPYWDEFDIAAKHGLVTTPVHHLGGWYDGFLRGTLENFAGLKTSAATEHARVGQRLTVGPWVHGPDAADQTGCGEMDFGADAAIGFLEMRLEWFDHWLKGVDNGVMERSPVKLFAMGVNRWREFSDWPPPGAKMTPLYLSGTKSGSCRSLNDGSLTLAKPEAGEPDSYEYDPSRPVPTLGGSHLGAATEGAPNGQMDQRPNYGLVLTYTGQVLEKDLDVTGKVSAVVYARSSAPDTDWIVKLVDVFPDGRAMLVCDGVLRARYRNSRQKPELLSGEIERYEIDLWGTSYVFQKGHRVQVIVTSSDFPRWDRNMNTGGVNAQEAVGKVALNSVYHDADHGSHILLPVML
ncbi:MAG: CocE/NonD family hydrolase [Chloroflexi bacterium]|nr:CocE/NonD family hydrolase [Chloroflexota bacterium]